MPSIQKKPATKICEICESTNSHQLGKVFEIIRGQNISKHWMENHMQRSPSEARPHMESTHLGLAQVEMPLEGTTSDLGTG
jgi:hypothetical protein